MNVPRAAAPDRLAGGEVAIRCERLGVELGGRSVLREVTIEVRARELVALVGPNGAGKSTLLAALAGDLPATGGIEIAGRPIDEWRIRELARERAVLPQHNSLAFPFTVQRVVEMGRAPWARTPREDEDEAAVGEALERTDMAPLADRPFPALSGGERSRASLARVVAQRAGLLLLDEPTAALDIRHQEEVLRLARERADAGDAVVVVLHDLSLAAAFADVVILLDDGTVVASGPPAEVLTPELLGAIYRHPVTVIPHPVTGTPVVLPSRAPIREEPPAP